MRPFYAFALVACFACRSPWEPDATISLWTSPRIAEQLDSLRVCFAAHGASFAFPIVGYPDLWRVDNDLLPGHRFGYWNPRNDIYLARGMTDFENPYSDWTLRHELLHWVLQSGDHGPIFMACHLDYASAPQ